jgi:dihydrofolate reductase
MFSYDNVMSISGRVMRTNCLASHSSLIQSQTINSLHSGVGRRSIQGGANTIQQFLNAGLVDEFFIHIAPVFLGSGIRLFDDIDNDKYHLQIVEVIPSDWTTHIRYKLTKK